MKNEIIIENSKNCNVIPTPQYFHGEREGCIELKMPTDEMYPLIFKGDDIIVHRQNELAPGKIGVFHINDKTYVRRTYYLADEKKLVVIADNPNYDVLIFDEKDLDDFFILGRIIASGRKITSENDNQKLK